VGPSRLRIDALNLPFPGLVHSLGSPELAALEQDHISPFRHIDCVDEPAGFDTQAGPWRSCRTIDGRGQVHKLSRVQLKGGLGAQDLEMKVRVGMVQADQLLQRPRSCVEGNTARVGLDDEAVINFRLAGAQDERLVGLEAWILVDGADGYRRVVDGQVLCRPERALGALNGRRSADVEIAF